jgi:hypothetical protein
MGFDPLRDVKFIRLAHEAGLGCGDTREIEIVGDVDAGRESWGFVGPFREMTFAARMQHQIYWGKLKTWIEWSLKTWLAPWAYVASVVYHDMFWYPFAGNSRVHEALRSEWGRLFHNWGKVGSTPQGYPDVGTAPSRIARGAFRLLGMSARILATCLREAPETAMGRRRAAAAPR